ncbi:MAG: rhodanese-related sulfurtransferase [Chthoniobacterales bacterium]
MARFVNFSAYKFTPFDVETFPDLRLELLAFCESKQLKGTILLAPEGINLFVAGTRENMDAFLEKIRTLPGLNDLTPKESFSTEQPFTRMLVKIKKEIIAFGIDGIDPVGKPAPKLPATVLKQWLDEGRKVTLLDTRNDYEVKMGTFHNALPAGIDTFREFPKFVDSLPEQMKAEPVVMICSGGTRCEQAGPYMEKVGFKKIYQLEGGILKYFEEVGGEHYDGECFVFDHRVGVDPQLQETHSAMCFHCQMPLTAEEQKHPHYDPPHSCHYCHEEKAMAVK